MKPKADPRFVRQVINDAEATNPYAAARKHRLHYTRVYRWTAARADSGSTWPTDEDIADWDARQAARARQAAIHQRYKKRRYAARGASLQIPATGTRRRLQALARLGYTGTDIATHLGVSPARVSQLMRGNRSGKYVMVETAAAVAGVFEQLCMTIPQGWTHDRARRQAEANGWPPPLAWNNIDNPDERPHGVRDHVSKHDVDPVVVDRVLAGERLRMTIAERTEVVRRARQLGWSFLQIEARTGVTKPERVAERINGLEAEAS
jgi:transcriptional regulator with XRE-family HTH domain